MRTRSIASRREQWVLTWVTASAPFVSIIVTRDAPHSSAISSVCPTNAGSLSWVASLFIGIVTMPAMCPASASRVAWTT